MSPMPRHSLPLIVNRIDLQRPNIPDAARPFFNRASGRAFAFRAEGDVAEIDLYDEIGYWGVAAADFRRQLKAVTAPRINLRINSPGGDVFDGIAMHNDLLDHPAKVTVTVTGIAASAASIVAMAGDEVVMSAGAFLMIHNAWAFGIGDTRTMAQLSDTLAKIDGALAKMYAAKTGQAVAEIARMMDEETWLDGDAAVEQGFASRAGEPVADPAAQAAFDLSGFQHAPRALRAAAPTGEGRTIRDFERALREAGASKSRAKAILAHGFGDAGDGERDADALDEHSIAAAARLIETMKGN